MFVKERKNKFFQIRVTEKEKDIIESLANKYSMSVSEFMLYLVDKHLKTKE